MRLVVVESPTKAKTLTKFLGDGYVVKASFGHVSDLPTKELGVDTEHDFTPSYSVPPKARKIVAELKALAKEAGEIILATDPDREGEAIAWHLANVLGEVKSKKSEVTLRQVQGDTERSRSIKSEKAAKPFQRVVFHEITKEAIQDAFAHPRGLDLHLVDAQQARRVLDRLVGYKLSPLLWKKIRYGLSAGRVQSVALRLIVEREQARDKFKASEYWTVDATLKKIPEKEFLARLISYQGKKLEITSEKDCAKIVAELEKEAYKVAKVKAEKRRREPYPPFTTSTLQQAAVNLLGFSGKRTMKSAQTLYEQGLITYHRTDSFNLAASAVAQLRETILKNYGPKYLPEASRLYKTTSRLAQEAHEAIRPTKSDRDPRELQANLAPDELKIYNLILRRTLACQMPPAVYNQTAAEIMAGEYLLRAKGSILEFDGWLAVFGEEKETEEGGLPTLNEGETLSLVKIQKDQHFTEPPARFTEATLIKELEENGIGRPSTYAPTITTIIDRGYVVKEGRALKPEILGTIVTRLLVNNFEEIVDIGFTAKMEGELDEIAEGKKEWVPLIRAFYGPFEKKLLEKEVQLKKEDFTVVQTFADKKCPECGQPLVEKLGKYGTFLSCSGFPKCKFAEPLTSGERTENGGQINGGAEPAALDLSQLQDKCPLDGGELQLKEGRFGKFIACKNYPKCKFTKPYLEKIGLKCPTCLEGEVVVKKTRFKKTFYGCSLYPKCKWASWQDPRTPPTPKTE